MAGDECGARTGVLKGEDKWKWGGVEVTSQGKTWKERRLAPRAVRRGVS